jgi:hypothetical protein
MASAGSNEWRRLAFTCAVLVPLLTVMQHFLDGYSWFEALFGGTTFTIGVAVGWWLFRIRPRSAASR